MTDVFIVHCVYLYGSQCHHDKHLLLFQPHAETCLFITANRVHVSVYALVGRAELTATNKA